MRSALPVAAVASVFGMQFIDYNEQTNWPPLIVVADRDGGNERRSAALGAQAGLVVIR